MRKRDAEYHTGRLNISCPPSTKEAIASDATAHGQSISQYILSLYEKSGQVGTSEHLARMGLDLVGIKKGLMNIDTRLRRLLAKGQGNGDSPVKYELERLGVLMQEADVALRETVAAVKILKEREQNPRP